MDNRIVLELIKKDLDELQILVEALQKDELPNQLLIDITVGRTKTLLQEFSLLQGVKTSLPTEDTVKVLENVEMKITSPKPEQETQITEKELPAETIMNEEDEPPIVEDQEPDSDELINFEDDIQSVIPEEEIDEVPVENVIEEEAAEEELPVEELIQEEPEVIEDEPVQEEVPEVAIQEEKVEETLKNEVEEQKSEEPEVKAEEKKILGEKFIKEPTLNERLAAGKNQETKIKGKPVTSLKKAIGLNDKFMYLRELFDNDNGKFEKAIDTLDACRNLIEAIEYLEQNFKWTKNETSLKFIALVKQRFSN